MRQILIMGAVAALAAASPVDAKGCIRGAVAGGVAGHYVGKGHALLGAVGGCAAMHHYYARPAAHGRTAPKAQALAPIRR